MAEFTFDGPEKPVAPGGLKTLTILTFIGSALGLLSGIYQYLMGEKNLAEMEKMVGSEAYEKMPEFAKKMYSPEMMEMTRKMIANALPIMLLTVVGSVLCIYGAMQMRKLKMSGYYLWLVGEILPFIGMAIFIGLAPFSGMQFIIGIAITVLFIILYTLQRKHLIYS